MSFLGNTPTTQSFTSLTERFNGNGSATTVTLSRAVYNASDIEVLVNNVQQDPYEAYTVNGTQTLTFTEAPSSGTGNIIVTYRSYIISKFIPAEGTVTAAAIADGSITGVKLASSTITGDKIGLTAITSNLIAANAITTAAIADGSINTSELATGAVTGDKIGLTAINANNIVAAAITGDKIASTATLGNLNVSGATTFLSSTLESANISTAMSATLNINIAQPYVVFTANSSANSTVNFTGLAGVSVGNSATFIVVVPNSSTAYYINTYQVDGSGTTVKWAGGAPLGGTSANTDVYSFVVIKTSATPTYNILAQVASYF
jgi:hypothetical protein